MPLWVSTIVVAQAWRGHECASRIFMPMVPRHHINGLEKSEFSFGQGDVRSNGSDAESDVTPYFFTSCHWSKAKNAGGLGQGP